MEKTLILIKPDAVKKNLIGEVLAEFIKQGLIICGIKMIRLEDDILAEHYSHLANKPFFPEIAEFMQETPVVALVLKGNSAVEKARDFLGATDPAEAKEGTLRKRLAESKMRNVCHASDSSKVAKKEIARFFRDEEVFLF